MIDNTDQLSANKQALLKIRQLKQQIAELQQQQPARSEPIAIVSMACRFPRYSNTPEKFWESLIKGADEVSEIPADRWDLAAFYDEDPQALGRMYARHGVFLDNLDQMDAEFFGISPREATWVDPQQRLLMEVCWEALERAGWTPEEIGPHTGVFTGWMHNDYQNEASDSFLNLNPYIATGAAGSFLCGRLAYYLGLEGPCVAVDTACSSSLVALHLACQSLQQRDCDRALVGGVNAICSPTTNILTCKLKALSPSGHSRAFDAAADGYLRGEGCGVVALRRLADAEAAGDNILGVIQGSAIGHNGFSSGLTAPNPKAQEKVIRQALQRAGLQPTDVQYLEAHGTGTELGDPLEMQAAAAALGADRPPEAPLLTGSVKTNIGHLEAAAGMAGLIKVLLSLQHRQLPGQLNFEVPNPHIPWDKIPVKVLTETVAWPQTGKPAAGVSAFGMSGANAHAIVTAYAGARSDVDVSPTSENESSQSPQLIVLSAKNEAALRELAGEYACAIASEDLADVAFTTATGRTHFEHRTAVVARTSEEARKQLQAAAHGSAAPHVFRGSARRAPQVAWQFTGQGSQYMGMGRQLYGANPVFREALDQCDAALHDLREGSLLKVLFEDAEAIHHTSWTQPAIFAVQMGLAKVLESYGLQPDMVLGHSVGQYAAACIAGMMSWQDGLQLISRRGQCIGDLPAGGSMLAVFAPLEVIEEVTGHPLTDPAEDADISLAAMNGSHIVISGKEDAIAGAQTKLKARKIRSKTLTTSHAFHSSLMTPALQPFAEAAAQFQFAPPQIPLVCNMTGQVLGADRVVDGEYWANHIRQPVQFAASIEAVQESGCTVLLEVGPQAVLTRMAAAVWQQGADRLVSVLQKDGEDNAALLAATGQLYVHGATPDFNAVYACSRGRRIVLPTYPFQRERYWGPDKPRAAHAAVHTAHPLLGGQLQLAGAGAGVRYENHFEPDSPPWLPGHEVMGQIVVPGAAYVEMALAASGSLPATVTDLRFEEPLRPSRRTTVQTVVTEQEEARTFEAYSSTDGQNWTRHFTASSEGKDAEPAKAAPLPPLTELQQQCQESVTPEAFYQKMQETGLNYSGAFQAVKQLHYSQTAVLSRLEVVGDLPGYLLPPPVLDGALHSLAVGLLHQQDDSLFLPVGIEKITCYRRMGQEVWCYATWTQNEGSVRTADLTLLNADGDTVAEITQLKLQEVSRAALRRMSGGGANRLLYALDWRNFQLPDASTKPRQWLIVADEGDALATEIETHLTSNKHKVLRKTPGDFQPPADDAQQETDHAIDLNVDGVAWLVAEDAESNCKGVLRLFALLQQQGVNTIECGVQFITRNGVAAVAAESCDPVHASYWGLGRVASAEYPAYRCRLIDVDRSDKDASAGVAAIMQTETRDNQFAVRDARILAPRLKPVRNNRQEKEFAVHSDRAYLVTGGLGQLGLEAARWLSSKGAGQIVLVSRRKPDEATQTLVESLQSDGCQVVTHQGDVGSADSVAALVQRFGADLLPLAGVLHVAGILDDALMTDQTWQRFEKVAAPKITGGGLLDAATRELPLDFFVLYSSAASVLGSPGQSNYATANAFLDGLAWQRRAAGLPATSINWGPWTAGMADDEKISRRLAMQGIAPLTPADAHAALEVLLKNDVPQATVIDADWRRMQMAAGAGSPPMLEELTPASKGAQQGDSEFIAKLKSQRGAAQRQLLIDTISALLQDVLGTNDAPETDRPLIEMGLDSLMAFEFSTQLGMMLGEQYPIGPTMLFDHPTTEDIATHILEMVAEEAAADDDTDMSSPASATAEEAAPEKTLQREDIAVVGMSCRFPGARSVDEFWRNLLNKVDSVGEIPPDRWDVDRFYDAERKPGKMYTRQGGFLEDVADFDAAFFNIGDQEACWMDPQHRLLLENCHQALEHANIPVGPSTGDKTYASTGVFMGLMGHDYAFLPSLDDTHVIEGFEGAGLSHSAGVGRISYAFGFEGPSIAIDTASSSSLVAVYQAMRSLQEGACDMALAGGVNAILAPANSLLMSKAGLLSPDGRCKSFSAGADGFGRGEGCGVVVLKRLSDAERDGDNILAVVRGGAVVHNGFSSSVTAPSGKTQSRAIAEALQDAGVAPAQVQYLEAHGTGTEFGDALELGAAAAVYGKGRRRDNPLLVGSAKANISHLEAAGGISGFIKTVLCLHHKTIPPQLHFDEPSPHIPWKRLPLQVVVEQQEWPAADERIAGVTAIGLVGTNAHVILSAPPDTKPDTAQPHAMNNGETNGAVPHSLGPAASHGPQILPLSARSDGALRELAGRYVTMLSAADAGSLPAICRAAGAGRRQYEYRAAVVANDLDEAISSLEKVKQGGGDAAGSPPRLAWLYDGARGCSVAEARVLYASLRAFRDVIENCQTRLRQQTETRDIAARFASWFQADNAEAELADTDEVFVFAVQAALTAVWRSWGIEPDLLLGAGAGQYAAACAAGCLSVGDAVVLLARREQILAAIEAGEDVEAALDGFEELADTFNYYPPNVSLVCSITGQIVPVHRSLGGRYWRDEITADAADGWRRQVVEASCTGVLRFSPSAAGDENRVEGLPTFHNMEGGESPLVNMLKALGALYAAGCSPDFTVVGAAHSIRGIALPHYPFQRKRYWITEIADHMPAQAAGKVDEVQS